MKIPFKKILIGTVSVPAVAVIGLLGTAELRWDRTFDAPYPDIHASTDSSVIARGRYLIQGPAHCAYCHTTTDKHPALDAGQEVPLSGGYEFKLPFGSIYSRNLTSDSLTGIGGRSDGELARVLRHAVRADGRAVFPFMPFQNMSDEDLTAIISYLRAQPPVRNDVPEHQFNLIGKSLSAFLIEPEGPTGMPPRTSPPMAPTIERGEYLANSVANCNGCHTNRSMMDGSAIGPEFAGGLVMEDPTDPTKIYVTPNLTPDPQTGHIANWTEDQFVARFRAGKVFETSEMPWMAFGRMSDDDLRALYRYLRSLDPVEQETGPVIQDKKD